jgi:hypothetical protein
MKSISPARVGRKLGATREWCRQQKGPGPEIFRGSPEPLSLGALGSFGGGYFAPTTEDKVRWFRQCSPK